MTSVTRTPLDDALTCISCGVPHTVRALDRSHVIPRARDPSRVDDPSNIVRQCRLCHTEIEPNKTARHKVEGGVYVYEKWSDEECSFVVGRQAKVKVDKRRGHLVEAGSPAAEAEESGFAPDNPIPVSGSTGLAPGISSAAAPSVSAKSSAAEGYGSSMAEPRLRLTVQPGDAGSNPARLPSAAEPFNLEIWKEQGAGLLEMEETIWNAAQAIQFAKGDWFLDGEQHLAEEVYGHLDTIRSPSGKAFRPGTLMQYIWVSKNVAPNTRVLELDWTHHRHVAALPAPEQKEWLKRAKEEGLNSEDLHRAIHGEKPKVQRWTLEELRELAKEWWALVKARPADDKTKMVWFLDWLEAK